MPNCINGQGNPNSKLLILGDFPDQSSDKAEKHFLGSSGELLDRIFTEIGHQNWRTEYWLTYTYRYRPPFNDIKQINTVCDVEEEKQRLYNEILSIKPNCILTIGPAAFETVTGSSKLLKYRGSILPSLVGESKVVGTISPYHLVRSSEESGDHDESKGLFSYVWKWVLANDIKRAIQESHKQRFDLPERLLTIARNSVDVSRFIDRRFKESDRVFADIETIECTVPGCISLAWNKYEAISIPLFSKVGKYEISSIPTTDLAFIWQKLDWLFRNKEVAGQNFKFDQAKLEMFGFTFKGLKSDTSLKAHTINPEIPHIGLAFLTSIWTREPYYKDEGKEFVFGKHSIDRWFLYNAKDSAVDCEVDEVQENELEVLSDIYHTDLKKFYYTYIIRLHDLYFGMEKVGFKVDDNIRGYLIAKYETWLSHLEVKLAVSVGRYVNYNSPKQVKELLYEQMRIKPIDKDHSTNEDVISRLLKDKVRDESYRAILSNILEIRRVNKTLSTYLYAMPDFDGRMRTQVRITGTETGRSSDSVLEPPVRPCKIGIAFKTITKHGDIGQDIRGFLIADPGYVIVNIDLSQAEGRVVALLSNDMQLLEAYDKIDIHKRTASLALFTGQLNLSYDFDPIADVLTKDSPERFIGKKTRHAGNYFMQWKEFMKQVISDCRRFHINFTISAFSAKKIIERFHTASPNIANVFHKEVKDEIDTSRALINPFGRLRRFFDRPGPQLYKEGYAFIPQSTVKDRLTNAALTIKCRKFPVKLVNEAHDSLTYLMPIGEYVDICKEIKPIAEEPIDFSQCSLKRGSLIIPSDFEVGDNYKDLERLKVN
jgi:uracil-DNA glycosylase family 4